MKKTYNLSELQWKLSGWTPWYWRLHQTMEIGANPNAEIPAFPAKVPGSVQYSLREAGIIPDWNTGMNARQCEWVENRHWIYETHIPNDWIKPGVSYRLNCQGLDYNGWLVVNGKEVARFEGSHIPHVFDLTEHLQEKDNRLAVVFDLPPRWLGQFGITSEMLSWKPRFYYTWDWVSRLVQVGIWDSITLEESDGKEIKGFRCAAWADAKTSTGTVEIHADCPSACEITLSRDGKTLLSKTVEADDLRSGLKLSDIPVELWWPNLHGSQPLYNLTCRLLDGDRTEQDSVTRKVGFKEVVWEKNPGAPEEADPWLCVVNGKPIFLQGANWVPVLPNFADVTEEDYKKRLELYRDLGFNVLRVWGGAILEKSCFYDMCDQYGIMVWQEFPLSSSGGCSYPPDDETSISELCAIAESYIARRQHHASLLLWSGGNELTNKRFTDLPVDHSHPLIQCFNAVVSRMDPTHRFIPSSPGGPAGYAHANKYGQGVHWDVHGPWKAEGPLSEWDEYWSKDDSLFRSECGAPGASPVDIICKYSGECQPMPANWENEYWRRGSTWWIEWAQFCAEKGCEPESLEEYVAWSQERQKHALVTATKSCKDRFPACGGIIFWMGHDCFPCTANTAIIDFHGNPKPAAIAIGELFKNG